MYKMIIVDDDYLTLEGMKLIIDWSEYNIEIVGTAFSGSEGVIIAKELKPDIILTDIKMRAMSGISMIEQIKNSNIECQFIIMSGYKVFEYAQKAMDMGVSSYLLKPINKRHLIDSVKKVTSILGENQAENSGDKKMIEEILQYINNHYSDDISLQKIAQEHFINTGYLSKIFKEYTGESYIKYVTDKKIQRAKSYLKNTDLPISEIATMLAFKDINYFSTLFKKTTGVSPQKYRKG